MNIFVLVKQDLRMYLLEEKIREFRIKTGPFGKGAVPRGAFFIKPSIAIEASTNPSFTDAKGFAWFAPLKEQGWDSTRTGLGLHPDGGHPGTEGCVGLTQPDTREVYDLLRDGGALYVL